tara:strand:- start:209 stop:901 length:693 start_codon:yes stop_codon:yes gene_type:complete
MTLPTDTTEQSQALPFINEMLAVVGQAPVNSVEDTNQEVAIAWNTLGRISKEVQSEGWTFNKKYDLELARTDVTVAGATQKRVAVSSQVVQMDLTKNGTNLGKDVSIRYDSSSSPAGQYLYDLSKNTFEFTYDPRVDVIELVTNESTNAYGLHFLPKPIQDYILARGCTFFSNRAVGSGEQYEILKAKEDELKAMALEFECNQADFTFFGHPQGGNYYTSYEPYKALSRY